MVNLSSHLKTKTESIIDLSQRSHWYWQKFSDISNVEFFNNSFIGNSTFDNHLQSNNSKIDKGKKEDK